MGGFPGVIKNVLLSPIFFVPRYLALYESQMCLRHATLKELMFFLAGRLNTFVF